MTTVSYASAPYDGAYGVVPYGGRISVVGSRACRGEGTKALPTGAVAGSGCCATERRSDCRASRAVSRSAAHSAG